jgi:hypothetical protein
VDFNLRLNGSPESGQQYLALSDGGRLILAYKIFGQFGFGDLPMASYAYYGSRGTTLGYAAGEFGPQPWLPGAWGSLTYKIMEEQDMRARLTAAMGKTGGALYFAIGQNF